MCIRSSLRFPVLDSQLMHKMSDHIFFDIDQVICPHTFLMRNILIKMATHSNIDSLNTQCKHTVLKPSDNTGFHCLKKCRFSGTSVPCGHVPSPGLGSLWLGVVLWGRRGRMNTHMWTTLEEPFVAVHVSAGAPSPTQPDRRLENCQPWSVALAWISTQIIIKSSVAQQCQCKIKQNRSRDLRPGISVPMTHATLTAY